MSVANGVGPPRLIITRPNGDVITINLPMTQLPGGTQETPNQVRNDLETFDRESISDHLGFKPRFTLDYSTVYDGVDWLTLHPLLEAGIEIVLIPHSDLPDRRFPVRLLNVGDIGRLGDEGHRGLKLQFECTKLLDAIPFPQTSLSGKTAAQMGTDTAADHSADWAHFYL